MSGTTTLVSCRVGPGLPEFGSGDGPGLSGEGPVFFDVGPQVSAGWNGAADFGVGVGPGPPQMARSHVRSARRSAEIEDASW
jgi:hypothetical protein